MTGQAEVDEQEDERELEELKRKIFLERGFHCHLYKDKCLRRRFGVRMRARGELSFAAYARLLDRDPVEYDLLLDALTINVSKFFRNFEVWEAITAEVIPHLFGLAVREKRVWSAGCAGGEEAYSVSVLLHEWAEQQGRASELADFRIRGTDIDRRSLETARRAEYPELSLVETPEPLRQRWFSAGPPFRLDERARRNVEFENSDLLSAEAEGEQSLILCRNVIIYFDRSTQETLFRRFYDSLVPGGFLVLGKVETLLGPTRSLFRPVRIRERIFRKPL